MRIFKRKRKGAIALEYIIVFPGLVLLMTLMTMALLMVMNIMKYNDIATETANNINFYTTSSMSGTDVVCKNDGGSAKITNQCSWFLSENYSKQYVLNSPYTKVESIGVKEVTGSGATSNKNGALVYVNINYKIFGLPFKSSGMNVVF